MEPTLYEFPKDGFLEQVQALAHEHGALLVFDEMLTGFRLAEGGGQELFGVVPDLATFGKGIANGMPIGVLAGPERYMRHFDKVFFSTTYGGEALTLAAAVATLDFYRHRGVIRRLWKAGKIILDNFNWLVREAGLRDHVGVIGYPVRQQMIFRDRSGQPNYLLTALFQQEMFKRGIVCYAGLGFSYSHTDAELMYTVEAFRETLAVLARAIEADDPRRFLEGKPAEPVFRSLRDQRQTSN
jgi:glutamate-1-semialdehyde aminotransferase